VWLLSPDVRAWLEQPKFHFQDATRRYDRDAGLGQHDDRACHLGGGTEPGTLSLLQTAAVYPRFSGREGGERDLVDRINGCMTRSMNGREPARDSAGMVAMVTYITSLGDIYAATGEGRREVDEPTAFKTPPRAADLGAGERRPTM
jgi:cytochrome c